MKILPNVVSSIHHGIYPLYFLCLKRHVTLSQKQISALIDFCLRQLKYLECANWDAIIQIIFRAILRN